ncbi:hypothetical protein GIB67_020271 [Kingdonia uniflora]|uniref:Ataxin-2 C-terminal domain-containing protein n=1 Tax=Kingdonia uniflora TaxID=39325 RepID=A0A7J7P3R3_9MAGN|nr:hypothetical protein GIB67_020271 [Kingdonia uniflora]
MEVLSHRTGSDLNPNAPLFIPRAYQTVEDYSDEWWELVRSSSWFSDYWFQHCFQDPQNTLDFVENDDLILPEIEAVFDGYKEQQKDDVEEEDSDYYRELVSLGALKWNKPKGAPEKISKYLQKVPKIVNVKLSPRPIQQPR